MAKMKSFKAEFGLSVEIGGIWHKYYAGVEIECEPNDDTKKVKEMAWNTVISEVEKQIEDTRKQY